MTTIGGPGGTRTQATCPSMRSARRSAPSPHSPPPSKSNPMHSAKTSRKYKYRLNEANVQKMTYKKDLTRERALRKKSEKKAEQLQKKLDLERKKTRELKRKHKNSPQDSICEPAAKRRRIVAPKPPEPKTGTEKESLVWRFKRFFCLE